MYSHTFGQTAINWLLWYGLREHYHFKDGLALKNRTYLIISLKPTNLDIACFTQSTLASDGSAVERQVLWQSLSQSSDLRTINSIAT